MKINVIMKAFQQTTDPDAYHVYHEVFEDTPEDTLHERIMKRIQELEGDSDDTADAANGYPWYSYEIEPE